MTLHAKELQKIFIAGIGFEPPGAIIAGGALTSAFSNKEINDVGYYFKSKEDFEGAIQDAYDSNMWAVEATSRAVTFTDKLNSIVQLMHFDYFKDAHAVFDAFDFTCCMGAYDIDSKQFVFHDNFLKHVAQRHLSFHNGTRFPFASLLRIGKYQERGYKIVKNDLVRIALRCHQEKLESWADLANAIGGQYGEKIVIEAGDKPFSIDAALELVATTNFFVAEKPAYMPGDAEDMLAYIEMLKVDPSVEWKYEM